MLGDGSKQGLNMLSAKFLQQKPTDSQNYDAFASRLQTGDFNGDGFKDLAVGIPYKDLKQKQDVGAVAVYFGSKHGLINYENLLYEAKPSENAQFSWSMASADFNHDQKDDLVISAPQKNIKTDKIYKNAGIVHLFYGSKLGLTNELQLNISQNSTNMLDSAENYDQFGWSLATGDFNHDKNMDLAIGVPFESEQNHRFSGIVQIINGTDKTLGTENSIWSQYNKNISGMGESGDKFGYAIAAGDYDGNQIDDLVIGVPGEDYFSSGVPNGGVAHIIFGTNSGLNEANNQMLIQNASLNNDMAEDQDQLGKVIKLFDINADGFDDILLGIYNEDIGNHLDAGLVQVVFGNAAGEIEQKIIISVNNKMPNAVAIYYSTILAQNKA